MCGTLHRREREVFDVGLFSGKKSEVPATPAAQDSVRPAGKSVPTPSRREAEAARRQRLNPTLTPKESKQKAREANAAARAKQLAATDAVPARALMRDTVDSRFNLLEISLPVMMVLLVITMLLDPRSQPYLWASYVTWAFLATMILDLTIMWRRFKKLAAERLPNEPIKGMLSYGFNRAMTFRRMRMPKPRVQRGDAI